MPVTVWTAHRSPPDCIPGQRLEPGFDDIATLSTLHQRFTFVRLPGSHLTDSSGPPFPRTLTTLAFDKSSSGVVWDLILLSDPEGPTLISCAVRLLLVSHFHDLLSAPSWRTVVGISNDVHFTGRMAPTPLMSPEIERVVQIDIGQ